MESSSETYSIRSESYTESRLKDRMARISSRLSSFWMTVTCFFQLNCCFESVEEQTEEDVARFIAMSLEAAKNGVTSSTSTVAEEEYGVRSEGIQGRVAMRPLESLGTTRFTNLFDKFGKDNTMRGGEKAPRQSRSVQVENGHVMERVSFFSSPGQEIPADSEQILFRCGSVRTRGSPYRRVVSLKTTKSFKKGSQNANTSTSVQERYKTLGWSPAQEIGDLQVTPSGKGLFGEACGIVEKGEKLKADTGLLSLGSTIKTLEVPQEDGVKTTQRLEAMAQAAAGVGGAAAEQNDSICQVRESDAGNSLTTGSSCGGCRRRRTKRKGFKGILRLFRRATGHRTRQVNSI